MTVQSRAFALKLEQHTATAIKAFYLELLKNLRRNPSRGGTPVDTGHARGNWILSVGAPALGELPGRGSADGNAASILAWTLHDGPIYINNNTPYILRLNDGWSDQAPAGFIERAIDEALAFVNAKFVNARIVVGSMNSIGGEAAENLASAYSPFGD